MAEHKCLPGVMAKCPYGDRPVCTYEDGSQCEKDNLAYLPPDIMEELQAYRAAGLSPDEIERLQEYMKPFTIQDMDRFREIMDAEKDGRLLVLPCKLTDTVYIVESVMKGKRHIGEKIVSAQIDHVTIGENGKPVLDVCTETGNWYGPLEAGEFWTTREEAEEELRKEADNG